MCVQDDSFAPRVTAKEMVIQSWGNGVPKLFEVVCESRAVDVVFDWVLSGKSLFCLSCVPVCECIEELVAKCGVHVVDGVG